MKLGTYCIAHTIREHDPAITTIRGIGDTLEQRGVRLKRPKIGYHITAIPPFRTTEEAAKAAAWICDYWDSTLLSLLPRSGALFAAYGTQFDFFRNPGVDAFVIRVKMDDVIARAIERGRKRIPDIAEWVYPPESYDFNGHVTIGKGEGISIPIQRLIAKKAISLPPQMVIALEPPKVLRENVGAGTWEPVA